MPDPRWNLHIPPGILEVICLSPWMYPWWDLTSIPPGNLTEILGGIMTPLKFLAGFRHLTWDLRWDSHLTLDLIFIVTFVYSTQGLGGFAHAAWDLNHNCALN